MYVYIYRERERLCVKTVCLEAPRLAEGLLHDAAAAAIKGLEADNVVVIHVIVK